MCGFCHCMWAGRHIRGWLAGHVLDVAWWFDTEVSFLSVKKSGGGVRLPVEFWNSLSFSLTHIHTLFAFLITCACVLCVYERERDFNMHFICPIEHFNQFLPSVGQAYGTFLCVSCIRCPIPGRTQAPSHATAPLTQVTPAVFQWLNTKTTRHRAG